MSRMENWAYRREKDDVVGRRREVEGFGESSGAEVVDVVVV